MAYQALRQREGQPLYNYSGGVNLVFGLKRPIPGRARRMFRVSIEFNYWTADISIWLGWFGFRAWWLAAGFEYFGSRSSGVAMLLPPGHGAPMEGCLLKARSIEWRNEGLLTEMMIGGQRHVMREDKLWER